MKSNNALLAAAKNAKNDEFYTQWPDIEREINAYLEFDPDVFRGKTLLLPCDDPEWSNFTKFFALHFTDLGLKKLISTSFAPNSNAGAVFYTPTLFELEDPGYDGTKSMERGRKFTLEPRDLNGDGVVNIDDLQWEYLEGDGDFRSPEVTALRDEADVVVTNPPFSLFKEFVPWLVEGDVKFSIIGNMNAITYKEVFVLLRDDKLWLGPTINSGDREFRVPENYPLTAVGQRTDEEGQKYVRVKGVRWFTNIEHGRRHEPLQLMTMADNLKFSKNKVIQSIGYPQYVNFEAIDVPAALATPSDYDGIMGVPITFLDKYNPDQFEIIGNSDDMDMTLAMGVRPLGHTFIQAYRGRGGTGHYSPGMRMLGVMEPEPRTVYKRILIRRKDVS
jgi:hypothetical protein